MSTSRLKIKPPPRVKREREPGEFASFTPQPRAIIEHGWLREVGAIELLPRAQVPTKTKTPAEAAYMDRVAALGCVVCKLLGYRAEAQVHHVRAGVGKAQRAGNYCTIPLCQNHHTGTHGVHGDKGCLRQLKMSELDLLDFTIGELQ